MRMLIGTRVWLFLKWVWRIEEPHIPEPYRMGRRSIGWAWFEAAIVAKTCYQIRSEGEHMTQKVERNTPWASERKH